jgi:hypothetical protein
MAIEETVSGRVGENPLPAKPACELGFGPALVSNDERRIYPCYDIRAQGIQPRGDFKRGVGCLSAAQFE